MNMVGTHWLWVTACFSMACNASTGSKRSINTTVPPSDCMEEQNPIGAEWYIGAGER